jgi:hypothetical protein
MLAINTMNANSLYKAALIYKQSGDLEKSEVLMAKSKSTSQYIDQKLMMSAK